jgi:hypothetical protein
MNHLEFAALESYVSPQEKNWIKWTEKVEAILGHDLDGENSEAAKAVGTADGYSLDEAHDAWLANVTAEQYAVEVEAAKKRAKR